MQETQHTIVATRAFIDAIRDAGYRGPAAALAELIDNAFEADATTVRIDVTPADTPVVTVTDDGTGMTPTVLETALQFGGSSRFGSRAGMGRYGMGLPAGSVSHARRVDVFTWTKPGQVMTAHIDVDAIRSGAMRRVPTAVHGAHAGATTKSGTIVVWSNCDRLRGCTSPAFFRSLRSDLGRIFREQLWEGRSIVLQGEELDPVDPLFRSVPFSDQGAVPYGPHLEFPVRLVDAAGIRRSGIVTVQFTELPIRSWQWMSNLQKRAAGISKGAGVSVLREGREIDHGWFFMGGKRRENYDDWWRCEVRFPAELDEFFGVTHTKQGIHPTAQIEAVLAPHIERAAHELNRRVRATFVDMKAHVVASLAAGQATRNDHRIEPLVAPLARMARITTRRGAVGGLIYRIERRKLPAPDFYVPSCVSGEVRLIINQQHLFDRAAYGDDAELLRTMELVLLSAARAEARFRRRTEKETLRAFREHWARVLGALLA